MAMRRIMLAYGIWMAALAVICLTVPSGRTAAMAALGLSAAAAIGIGIRRYLPERTWMWLALVAALVCYTAGRVVYELLPGPADSPKADTWVVCALYWGMFAFMVTGLLGLARSSARERTS